MPKRLCALSISPDGRTVFCGDKFGDVYSLPMLPGAADCKAPDDREPLKDNTTKSLTPAATSLTVHTGRNRKALESQLRDLPKNVAKAKKPLEFTHQLLLGHVSMLTDLLVATVEKADFGHRTYLFTADRDEHIRISRGPSQSHIIEGYCLGHKEFVSKLCLVEPNILVSGGGDDHLFVWDWLECKLLAKINLKSAVEEMVTSLPDDVCHAHISISGIWKALNANAVFVICEGVPALFFFPIHGIDTPQLDHRHGVIPLSGNPLDVALYEENERSEVLISVDNIHRPASMTQSHDGSELERSGRIEVFAYSVDNGVLSWKSSATQSAVDMALQKTEQSRDAKVSPEEQKSLQTLLYSVGKLRKSTGEESIEPREEV